MEPPLRYLISFEGLSAGDATRAAQGVERAVRSADPALAANILPSQGAMDVGSVVEVLLGTRSVVALAKALGNWLARDPASKLTVTFPDGRKLVVDHLSSRQASELAKEFLASARR